MSVMNPSPHETKRVYRAIHVDLEEEIPTEHEPTHVYIVGIRGNRHMAVMKCPCDCGDLIRLNLLATENPCWAWNVEKWGEVTFAPSIKRTVKCISHFFIREGMLSWCEMPAQPKQ